MTITTLPELDAPVIACSAFNAILYAPVAHRGPLLDQVSVNLTRGAFTAITGRPGSGARELAQVLGGRRRLDAGRIIRATEKVAFVAPQLDAARLSTAITRALAAEPELIVVDAFGWACSAPVIAALRTVAAQRGITVLLATDDLDTAADADRVLILENGRLVADL